MKKVNKKIRSYSTKKKKTIKTILKSYEVNGKRKETSIEKKVREFLEEEGISFIQEKFIKYKDKEKWAAFDFMINPSPDCTFFIEADGVFWHGMDKHGDPLPEEKLLKVHKKNIRNDKAKNKLAKTLGIPLIRLKECDIKNNFQKVKDQILNEIKRQTIT